MKNSLGQRMFDAGVRVDTMFWIAGICAEAPYEFQEFIEEDLPDCSEIIEKFPWLKASCKEGALAEDVLSDFACRDIDGIFVQLSTPTPHDFFDGGYSSTWGSCRLKWFFCSTLEEVADKAEAWQKEVVAKARERATA